ncbi:MAG: tetraacyldisaccharide 4'-kinase [Pseudomonadota bacterium]|nr:tetraacyldisaccharide 4'-kinase [Pseudomonadota bacterium]
MLNYTTNLLTGPAWLYGMFMAGRNLLYDLIPALSQAVEIPVICVGNLTTGGTGKTPMVAYLADYFHKHDLKVAILSRGYGRKEKQNPKLITKNSPIDNLAAAALGDEILMLHQQIPEAALVLDGDRIRGAKAAIKYLTPDLVLMDDGFQHRRLRRDFNLLMIDSQRLFGNRHMLPAGSLREPLKAIKRADAVVLNKFDQRHPDFYDEAAEMLNYISPKKVFCSSYHFRRFSATAGSGSLSLSELKNLGPLCACSGLANNDYFFAQLRSLGLQLEETASFNDHYDYREADLKKLIRMCESRPLIITAKDAVKLKALAEKKGPKLLKQLWIAEIGLKIDHEDAFLKLFEPFIRSQNRAAIKPAHP